MHTIGIGNGADENLVVGCAAGGFGGFTFVYNKDEIEAKVISQLSKAKLEYLVVSAVKLFD